MIRSFTPFLLALLFAPALLHGQLPQRYNTTLFGTLNPAAESGGRYSALTGYTAPDGREYAILGGFLGTHIIDVTDSPIKQVAFIAGPPNGWREMKTYSTYAYVVSEGGAGLQIIDLSQLPTRATLVQSDTSLFRTAHTIAQQGGYLYINGTKAEAGVNGGTMVLDVESDPRNPRRVGAWTAHYVHDCTVRNDTLYASALENGLDIVYLGPTGESAELVANIEYSGSGTHNADLTIDGGFIMTTDEVNATPKTLKIWDRRDPNSITKVADFTPVPGEIVHNVHTKGRLAFVAWYTAGTRIIDVSNPFDPAEVGYYDFHPGASADFSGNWEVYPYLPSGKILASDMQNGLVVFTFNGAERGNVHGVVRDASTGNPIAGAVITIDRFGRTIISDDQGRYNFSGAVDTLAYSAMAMNYVNDRGTLQLTAQGNERDILLTPLVLTAFDINPVDALTGAPITGFGYRVIERAGIDGRAVANPQTVQLPRDSVYHLYVGAWGYRPKMVEVRNQEGVLRVPLDRGYFDDAELDLGWSFAAASDTASAGRWERGIPIWTGHPDGTTVQPPNDNSSGFADHAFITGIAGSEGGVGANDVDAGATSLTSPAIDLSNYPDPIIDCAIWYSRNGRPDAVNDTLLVLISGDDGESWITMEKIAESPQVWRDRHYRVRDYITPTASVRFRIVASDYDPQSLVEAGLDDFAVSGQVVSSVPEVVVGSGSGVASYALHPNPFSGSALLAITMSAAQRDARLELYDAFGRHVRTLYEGAIAPGTHSFTIDGNGLASGRYLWRLTLENGAIVSGGATLVR